MPVVKQASKGWNPNLNSGSWIPEDKGSLMQRSREREGDLKGEISREIKGGTLLAKLLGEK